jgi:hypothetical protein
MSTYTTQKLNLSKMQCRRLANGHTVQVRHEDIGAGHAYHMTPMQARKLATAKSKGKGLRFSMSAHQANHNVHHGAGWFSNLFSKVKDFVQANGRSGLKAVNNYFNPNPLAKRAADVGIDFLADKIGLGKGLGAKKSTTKGKGMASFKVSVPPRGGSFRAAVPPRRT